MMNKKGFTLVEILAVIVIIGILVSLAVAGIIGYRKKANEKYYNALADQLLLATKNYYSNNPDQKPRGQLKNNELVYRNRIDALKLLENNYLTNDIVDVEGNDCSASAVRTTYDIKTGKYSYDVCLLCGDNIVFGDENICEVRYVEEKPDPDTNLEETIDITPPVCGNYNIEFNDKNNIILEDIGSYDPYTNGTIEYSVDEKNWTENTRIKINGNETEYLIRDNAYPKKNITHCPINIEIPENEESEIELIPYTLFLTKEGTGINSVPDNGVKCQYDNGQCLIKFNPEEIGIYYNKCQNCESTRFILKDKATGQQQILHEGDIFELTGDKSAEISYERTMIITLNPGKGKSVSPSTIELVTTDKSKAIGKIPNPSHSSSIKFLYWVNENGNRVYSTTMFDQNGTLSAVYRGKSSVTLNYRD